MKSEEGSDRWELLAGYTIKAESFSESGYGTSLFSIVGLSRSEKDFHWDDLRVLEHLAQRLKVKEAGAEEWTFTAEALISGIRRHATFAKPRELPRIRAIALEAMAAVFDAPVGVSLDVSDLHFRIIERFVDEETLRTLAEKAKKSDELVARLQLERLLLVTESDDGAALTKANGLLERASFAKARGPERLEVGGEFHRTLLLRMDLIIEKVFRLFQLDKIKEAEILIKAAYSELEVIGFPAIQEKPEHDLGGLEQRGRVLARAWMTAENLLPSIAFAEEQRAGIALHQLGHGHFESAYDMIVSLLERAGETYVLRDGDAQALLNRAWALSFYLRSRDLLSQCFFMMAKIRRRQAESTSDRGMKKQALLRALQDARISERPDVLEEVSSDLYSLGVRDGELELSLDEPLSSRAAKVMRLILIHKFAPRILDEHLKRAADLVAEEALNGKMDMHVQLDVGRNAIRAGAALVIQSMGLESSDDTAYINDKILSTWETLLHGQQNKGWNLLVHEISRQVGEILDGVREEHVKPALIERFLRFSKVVPPSAMILGGDRWATFVGPAIYSYEESGEKDSPMMISLREKVLETLPPVDEIVASKDLNTIEHKDLPNSSTVLSLLYRRMLDSAVPEGAIDTAVEMKTAYFKRYLSPDSKLGMTYPMHAGYFLHLSEFAKEPIRRAYVQVLLQLLESRRAGAEVISSLIRLSKRPGGARLIYDLRPSLLKDVLTLLARESNEVRGGVFQGGLPKIERSPVGSLLVLVTELALSATFASLEEDPISQILEVALALSQDREADWRSSAHNVVAFLSVNGRVLESLRDKAMLVVITALCSGEKDLIKSTLNGIRLALDREDAVAPKDPWRRWFGDYLQKRAGDGAFETQIEARLTLAALSRRLPARDMDNWLDESLVGHGMDSADRRLMRALSVADR